MIQGGRHSTSQHGTEPGKKPGHSPRLFTQQVGYRGNEAGHSSKHPGPSPLLVSSLAAPKPVSKTGSTPDAPSSDTAPCNIPVDYGEFPRILARLKREDKTFADFAAGHCREIPLADFDLLMSLFRSTSGGSGQRQQQVESKLRENTSSGAGSHSHSPGSGTGLRLAQYTLEGVAETRRPLTYSSARLLELLSSAKNALSMKNRSGSEETRVDLSFNPELTGSVSGELEGGRYAPRKFLI